MKLEKDKCQNVVSKMTFGLPLHTHDYLNSRTKFETLVWQLMKGLARNYL